MTHDCCSMKLAPKRMTTRETLSLYRPILVVALVSLCGALALADAGRVPFMDGWMGLFLGALATLQMFDIRAFAASFANYDMIAAHLPVYGLAYPFIELILGLSYLAGAYPLETNLAMIAVGLIGAIGVARTIQTGTAVTCACVGTAFNLPVG